MNIQQIKKGLAPRSTLDESITPSFYTKVRTRMTSAICSNNQNVYEFQIEQLPLLKTLEFTSSLPEESYLNHLAGENVILFLVVSVRAGGNQEVSYVVKRIDYTNSQVEIIIKPEDFMLINTL